MPTPLHFNAFVMNTGSHIQHGQWRHPEAQQADFNDVTMWIELAKTLEAGLFDAMFFADVVGLYGPSSGGFEVFAREGLQIPSNDPSVLLSALAVNTEHLGFAFTSNVQQEHPFNFARKVSTLDHISRGRIAWNIVTGLQDNGARNFGMDGLANHTDRYGWAEEYVDVTYKLWEGSWDEGALLKDKASGVFSDASKIHKINHVGERYRVEGPHLPSPSPQRTPLLYQAGASPRGRQFAADHAEAVFLRAPTPKIALEGIEDTRRRAVEAGRLPQDLKFFQGVAFIIGSTEDEARRKATEYDEYASADGYLAHANIGTRPDGSVYPADTPLSELETNSSQGLLDWIRRGVTDREPVVADIADSLARNGRIVGTPEQIADALETWQREGGIDGVNVMNWHLPGSFTEFNEHLLPVLQARGLARTEYAPGTLRGKLFGEDRLNDRHPATRYRGAFSQ
ncbi:MULTISPECIES: LLM class flavin-dependent oxidoreductase [unclassified Arthrobacter]|uniref:LLM class flavin-dependent oxidoreductase n=1 Tax=unclassified Arthrobacter TaxID=235627 RepID=UPI00339A7DC1